MTEVEVRRAENERLGSLVEGLTSAEREALLQCRGGWTEHPKRLLMAAITLTTKGFLEPHPRHGRRLTVLGHRAVDLLLGGDMNEDRTVSEREHLQEIVGSPDWDGSCPKCGSPSVWYHEGPRRAVFGVREGEVFANVHAEIHPYLQCCECNIQWPVPKGLTVRVAGVEEWAPTAEPPTLRVGRLALQWREWEAEQKARAERLAGMLRGVLETPRYLLLARALAINVDDARALCDEYGVHPERISADELGIPDAAITTFEPEGGQRG